MATNRFAKDFENAFCLDEVGIKSFFNAVQKFTQNTCTTTVTFFDEFSYQDSDVSNIIDHAYFRSHVAKSLYISSRSKDSSRQARIECSKSFGAGKISVVISSEGEYFHAARADITNIVTGLVAPYSFVYRPGEFAWLIFAFVTSAAIGLTYVSPFWKKHTALAFTEDNLQSIQIFSLISSVGIGMFLLYAGSKLKQYLFPRFTIAIGKQKSSFESKKTVRKWIYGFLAGTMTAYVFKEFYNITSG